ncbi:sugar ABC transporter substrate-binding protein [Brevibacillus reuszeri]|uniref:ABC transporter substrate-binding protein n=1 Tax=Brevibacillus reuszeri TaxID=54915 RepID=A0A0K9YLA8_9BACL|nr:sugar ABC transporter substrate-binding protein [Brevibacillus reuszeri]KNB69441.1 ABC transporter substrate-binding protein [Brevibacillus reuszeri]MED1860238.1 sugar ABC transporter substrate-binding protein [Brevibacillus reuszeri]GED70873.1 sugar ABC transporter substrate-binding protein [Brevibacillus reuszeri]
MKKRGLLSTIGILGLLTAVLFTGCSSQPSTTEGGQVELFLGYSSDPPTKKKMEEIIAKFQTSHPNIKIKTETAPYEDFYQKLTTQIAAGTAPDIWQSDGTKVFGFAQRGAIRDITDYVTKEVNKDEVNGLEFNKDADGKYWGVPQGIQVGALFYNKDLFDKAGVSYPTADWTWDDLKAAAAKLTLDANGKNADDPAFDKNSVKQFGFTFFGSSRGAFNILKAYGGGVLDPTMTKSIINSPENKKAVEWMADGMKRRLFPNPADLKAFQSNFKVFLSGASAMQIDIYAATTAMNGAELNYDVAPLPKGPDGKRFAPVIANSWVINKKANEQKVKAAQEWITYWTTSDEAQVEWTQVGEAIPVKKSVANSDKFLTNNTKPENKKVFLDSLEFAGTIDTNAVFAEWVKVFTDNLSDLFMDKYGVDEYISKTDQGIQKVLDDFFKK